MATMTNDKTAPANKPAVKTVPAKVDGGNPTANKKAMASVPAVKGPAGKKAVAKSAAAPLPAKASAPGAAKDGEPGAFRRRFGSVRFGLLPVTIFAAVLLLGVRVVDVWSLVATRNGSVPDIPASEAKDAVPATPVGTAPAGAPVTGANRPPPQPGGRMQVAENAPKPAPAAGKDANAKPAGQGEPAKDGAAKEGGAAAGDPLSPIDNEQLLKHYADRREELDKKAKDVSMREALLTAAEGRIDQKLKELEKVKQEIQGFMKTGDDRQSQQVESLVKIYETMKPKDAARIFEELDMPILLEVFQKMKEAKTAPILAAMDPAKAKAVTSALLERHALPSGGASQ